MDGEGLNLNLQIDSEHLAGVYANYSGVSFSDYEFTIMFARVEHDANAGEMTGIVVSRVNLSPKAMNELLVAMTDIWSSWSSREEIKNRPETQRPQEDS